MHLTVDFCPAVCPGADLNNLPSLDSRKYFCGIKRGFSLKLRKSKDIFLPRSFYISVSFKQSRLLFGVLEGKILLIIPNMP